MWHRAMDYSPLTASAPYMVCVIRVHLTQQLLFTFNMIHASCLMGHVHVANVQKVVAADTKMYHELPLVHDTFLVKPKFCFLMTLQDGRTSTDGWWIVLQTVTCCLTWRRPGRRCVAASDASGASPPGGCDNCAVLKEHFRRSFLLPTQSHHPPVTDNKVLDALMDSMENNALIVHIIPAHTCLSTFSRPICTFSLVYWCT